MEKLTKKKKIGNYLMYMNEELGQGAFGQVYRGVVQTTEEPVAIKVADKKLIEEDEYTKNAFYSQIQIMKHLQSRNIIKFLDVHETKHNYYIIQELAEGGTLRQYMKEKVKFQESDALYLFTQLLNGFGELVKNGIIHRDIKPENILRKDNLLKIADFGFAKQSDNNSFMKTILGSPLYMSPQILDSKPYSYKCDIWALGVILYQLLVGRPPWNLKSNDMLQNINSSKVVFPSDLKISKQLQQFVAKCLQYNQDDRYDWEGIYLHPLFAEKFKQNFEGANDYSIKLAFIVSGMRMSMHSKNIDLSKLIQQIPNALQHDQFFTLLKLIDQSLNKNQIQLVYQHCLKKYANGGTVLKKQQFGTFLKQIGIRLKSIDLAQINQNSNNIMDGEQIPLVQTAFLLIARLKHKIQENDVDIFELYRSQDKSRTNALAIKQFSTLVLKIDPGLNQSQIKVLFEEIDLNKDGKISFNEFYKNICKIAGVFSVQDEKSLQIFKKK